MRDPVSKQTLALLEGIEHARNEMFRAQNELWELRQRSFVLRRVWEAFEAAGGSTPEDWVAYLKGQALFPGCRVKGHLRLVSSRNMPRRAREDTGAA